MLKFRRAAPTAIRTEPAPPRKATPTAPAETTNAGKARALLAMLEQGSDASAAGIEPERLRAWARDLVETVERRRAASESEGATPAALEPKARLFKTPAPKMMPASGGAAVPDTAERPSGPQIGAATAEVRPQNLPVQPVSAARLAAAAAFRLPEAAPTPAALSDLPVQHVTEGVRPSTEVAPAMLTRMEVRRLIDATTDPETLAREHPAIIAMTLVGRSTLEQAAALRRLPGGQVRAVHRALRLMEGAAP